MSNFELFLLEFEFRLEGKRNFKLIENGKEE